MFGAFLYERGLLLGTPLIVAKACTLIERVYISTDSTKLKEIASSMGCLLIDRPRELASKEALGEDAFVHGFNVIKNILYKDGLWTWHNKDID